MVFSSPIFLFLFLPLFLAGYYLIFSFAKYPNNENIRRLFFTLSNIVILAASLLFYFWGEAWLVFVMLTSTVIDYCCGLAIGRSSKQNYRKTFLVISIVANLSLLAFFKYINFGIDNFNALAGSLGLSSWQVKDFMDCPFLLEFT